MLNYFEHEINREEKFIAIIDVNKVGDYILDEMENICKYIQEVEKIDISEYKIFYKDASGFWDGIKYNGLNRLCSIITIRERNFFNAKNKFNE